METKKKYQSKRLKGMQGEWSDTQFLEYVMFRVDFRSSNNELYEASASRFLKIIERLKNLETYSSVLQLVDSVELPPDYDARARLAEIIKQHADAKQ